MTSARSLGREAVVAFDKVKKKKGKWRKPDAWRCPNGMAYQEGLNAFWANSTCPFEPHTMEHREWQRGFDSSYFRNLASLR
tara:strand:- start:882 stop:1124 length:243 start_codon:yes stop_codon:yes gene_type:complete